MQRIYEEQPLPPSTHNPAIPAWLDGVVRQALSKDPLDRHPGAHALRTALMRQREPVAAVLQPARVVMDPLISSASTLLQSAVPPKTKARQRRILPAWLWLLVAGFIGLLLAGLFVATLLTSQADHGRSLWSGLGSGESVTTTVRAVAAMAQPAEAQMPTQRCQSWLGSSRLWQRLARSIPGQHQPRPPARRHQHPRILQRNHP